MRSTINGEAFVHGDRHYEWLLRWDSHDYVSYEEMLGEVEEEYIDKELKVMKYSKKSKIKSIKCMLEHIMSNPELDYADTIDIDNLIFKNELLCELSHTGLDMVIAEIEDASDLKWKEFVSNTSPIHKAKIENPVFTEDVINYEDYFQHYWTAETSSDSNAIKFIIHFYKSGIQHDTEILYAKPIEVWHAVSLWYHSNTDETYLNFKTRIPYLAIKELKEAKNLRPATPDEINELNEKWKKHEIEIAKLRERMEAKRNDKREI